MKAFTCGDRASSNPGRVLLDQGFIITPNLVNPSIVEKLRIYADDNCIECDAVQYMIQGWAENEWVLISSGDLPWKSVEPPRNDAGVSIRNSTYDHGDESLSFTEITLNNTRAFSEYRLTFPETRNGSYTLVVAELELPGRTFEERENDSPTASPSVKVSSSKPTRVPAHSTSKPTPLSTGAKTSKPTSPKTTQPTRKPSPRPFRQHSKTSSKNTKSKASKSKASKSKASDEFPGINWDDFFKVRV
jgi:hypothetical protein